MVDEFFSAAAIFAGIAAFVFPVLLVLIYGLYTIKARKDESDNRNK